MLKRNLCIVRNHLSARTKKEIIQEVHDESMGLPSARYRHIDHQLALQCRSPSSVEFRDFEGFFGVLPHLLTLGRLFLGRLSDTWPPRTRNSCWIISFTILHTLVRAVMPPLWLLGVTGKYGWHAVCPECSNLFSISYSDLLFFSPYSE